MKAKAVPPVAIPPPPPAAVQAVVETHHGIEVVDPYRQLEDLADPAVQAWARQQADHAAAVLDGIPGRGQLRARIDELAAAAEHTVGAIDRLADGGLVYSKQPAGADLAVVCLQEATGAERVVVDPATLPRPGGGGHVAVSFFVASPDGRLLLHGAAAAGSEQETLRVRDLATGRDLRAGDDTPLEIDRLETAYARPSWLPDSRSFLYIRRQKPAADAAAADAYRFTQAFLHRLDGEAAAGDGDRDILVFGQAAPGSPEFEPMDFPAVIVPRGSRWAIGQVHHGDEQDISLWALPLADLGSPAARWQPVCTRADLVTDFAVHGDDIYLVTARDAPRARVVRTSLIAADLGRADVVVPAGEAVVHSVAAAADALYVGISRAAIRSILRVPYEQPAGREAGGTPLAMPAGEPSATIAAATADLPGILLRSGSWIRAGRIHAYDPATGSLADTGLAPAGPFDAPDNLVARELLVPSHDGVEIPLSIMHRRDLVRDGSNPVILSGYGAYGSTPAMQFSPTSLAWLERGGVLAVAHVRGGGTFGKAWHHAGRKTTKPNTWKDFLACGDYLVREGYTSPDRLAARGGSAGGILVGRAITERPDLFVAAQIAVGCTDMLRFEFTQNGPPNIPEFGSLADPEEFRGLLAMSTLHHVADGTAYPAVLLTHGLNDPRVEPWQSFKTAARLQAATTSGQPVLLRLDGAAGHGIGSTRSQRHAELADVWSFVLWQCGDPAFQPLSSPLASPRQPVVTAAEFIARHAPAATSEAESADSTHETRDVLGWTLYVNRSLVSADAAATETAVRLLEKQLAEVVRVVPPAAVAELRQTPLWFSPEYPGVGPKAEFHPDANWLRNNGRDPVMARAIEFTNIRIFPQECERMPNFALHELAHAYHFRVLGFDDPAIRDAFERARAAGLYDKVEQHHGNGRPNSVGRAYAMTDEKEYFAESSEAYFSRNDFFPFTRDQLAAHDPRMLRVLETAWGVASKTTRAD
jgi:prolyl oligopeptidase